MAKRCPEEFNPWPPFVDIFASVILVMLLFLLITIVNIGYYAQFKHKVSYTASVVTKAPVQAEDQSKVQASQVECKPAKPIKKRKSKDDFSLTKTQAPQAKKSNESIFEGGKAQENSISDAVGKTKEEFVNQKIIKKELILIVRFQDKEIFINSKIKRKIKLFISDIKRRSKRAVFTIQSSDPANLISSTMAKQVSLGRVLNVKSIVKRSHIDKTNIKMDLQHNVNSSNPNGDIIIKVYIP